MKKISVKLIACAKRINSNEPDLTPSDHGSVAAPLSRAASGASHGARITRLLDMTITELHADTPVAQRPEVKEKAMKLLKFKTMWLDSTQLRSNTMIRDLDLPNADKDLLVWRAMRLVSCCFLGTTSISNNTHGVKKMHLIKRCLTPQIGNGPSMHNVIDGFGVSLPDYAAETLEVLSKCRPPNAAPATMSEFDAGAVEDILRILREW